MAIILGARLSFAEEKLVDAAENFFDSDEAKRLPLEELALF